MSIAYHLGIPYFDGGFVKKNIPQRGRILFWFCNLQLQSQRKKDVKFPRMY